MGVAIGCGGFLTLYNSVAMNIAIPSFMSVFQCDLKTIQWIMISYTLAMGVLSPTAGYFSDRISCRNLFAGSMVGFAIAATMAGLCQDIYQMIFFRVIQGLLAAFIIPCSMMIVYQYVPSRKRATYLSLQSASLSFGPAVGPVIAGYLLMVTSWQWIFWLNVPLALITAYAVWQVVPYETRPTGGKLNYLSFSYVIMGTVLVLLSFNLGADWGLLSLQFLGMLALGLIFIGLFIKGELKSEFPILNFRVLKYPAYVFCLLINSMISMALCLAPFVLAIYFQNILGLTPLESGLLLLVPAVFSIGGAPLAQWLYSRMDSKWLIFLSVLFITVGNYFLSRLTLATGMAYVLIFLCLRYLGIGLSGMPITDYGMKAIPSRLSGHGSSFLNWCKMMATSLSLSIFTMILTMRTITYEQTLPKMEAQLMGVNDVFLYSSFLMMVAVLLTFKLRKQSKIKEQ